MQVYARSWGCVCLSDAAPNLNISGVGMCSRANNKSVSSAALAWVQTLALPLRCWVTLGNLFTFSVPSFITEPCDSDSDRRPGDAHVSPASEGDVKWVKSVSTQNVSWLIPC